MTFLAVDYETKESILLSLDRIANKIVKDIQIRMNNACYRIVDFEFYSFSDKFPDPYTHKNKLQLQNSKFYLHGSGVDITYGDGTNYGGILLRSVVKLYDVTDKNSGCLKEQFSGPLKVATELFSNLYPLDSLKKNEIILFDMEEDPQKPPHYPAMKVIKTARVGLASKTIDKRGYYKNLSLRYISVLQKSPYFKQSIKGIESLVSEKVLSGEYSLDVAKDILGYNRIF